MNSKLQKMINRPLTFDCVHVFQYLCNLILNADVDFANTTSWGKLFQKLIRLLLK